MSNFHKIKGEDLELNFDNVPYFSTTEEISPYNDIIGQKRAIASIDLGLKIDKKEYNIFISGRTGTGKTGYIVKRIESYAKNLRCPEDWCYVYNFEDSSSPSSISLPTGTAAKFKEDVLKLINHTSKQVSIFFNSKNYNSEKETIINKYNHKMLNLSKELNSKAEEIEIVIKQSSSGEFVFIPMKNGKEISQDEFDKLSQEERDIIDKNITSLRLYSIEVIKSTRQLSKQMDEELKHLDDKIGENIISLSISDLLMKYGTNEKIINYIKLLNKDIISNITSFLEPEDDDNSQSEARKLFFRRYNVNVLVSNDPSKGAPVVFADSGQYSHLFGDIEYENKLGNLITDFSLITPGCLHEANGGFLIIKAHQLLSNPLCFEELKKCINLETIFLESSNSSMNTLPISTLKPENIPLKVKVILIGSNSIYSLLLQRDVEFEKLFKIKAEFDSQIENDPSNISGLIGYISNYVRENNFNSINRNGVLALLAYSSRLSESRKYFSSSMSRINKIIDISHYFSKDENLTLIDENHIKKAILENDAMHGLIKEKILNMYKSKKYMVDLNGSKIGQINGLSVIDYGDCIIGQQHKITANTFAGKNGVINIEKETNMSGSIHSKGILILSGFVGQLIGQEASISFNASIVFEQLYSGIEGDSASAAELIALLSSLSDIPLKQSLAITGSVNQKGEIQPIGGIIPKIEGYFDICSIQGLDGTHGVVIPETNLDDLVLDNRVIEAVKADLFHIYTVNTIEDCLEIFCDYPINIDSDSAAMISIIKEKILNKLQKYNKLLK